MKSEARSAAGRAAWAAKSPAEKARIRARLAAGRSNLETVRGNLTNWETRQLSGLVKPKTKKGSKASAPKTVKTTSRKAPASSKKRSPAQLANDQRLRDMAIARAAGSKRPRNAPASASKVAASSGKRSAKQLANDKRLGELARRRAAERKGAETVAESHARLAGSAHDNPTHHERGNLTPRERARLERVLQASANKRAAASKRRKANASRKAAGLSPLKPRKSRKKSSRKARKNTYIARPNAYIATRANGEESHERDNRSRRRRSRKGARRNMYIRRNPGLEMAKKALILTGLGVGSFMTTNVVHHFVSQLEFAEGPIADYGVPAALTALVWFGPTGKFLAGNKMIGKHGQIALTAGIVGAVANRMLDNIITDNLAKIPVIGEHTSKLLRGWPILTGTDAESVSGVGEYVYDLPDDGMGEYVRDPSRLSVEREMKGLAYVDLEQRAANEAALQAANLKVLQPENGNNTSQFDDQFDPAY